MMKNSRSMRLVSNSAAKDLGINPQTLRNWLGKGNKRQDPHKDRAISPAQNRKTLGCQI